MACPCIITAEFLTRRGATHAAAMHLDRDKAWTADDWCRHIEEEDVFLRPLMVKHFPILVIVYDEDHRIFWHELDTAGRIVSEERMKAHGALEDAVVHRLIAMGY